MKMTKKQAFYGQGSSKDRQGVLVKMDMAKHYSGYYTPAKGSALVSEITDLTEDIRSAMWNMPKEPTADYIENDMTKRHKERLGFLLERRGYVFLLLEAWALASKDYLEADRYNKFMSKGENRDSMRKASIALMNCGCYQKAYSLILDVFAPHKEFRATDYWDMLEARIDMEYVMAWFCFHTNREKTSMYHKEQHSMYSNILTGYKQHAQD